MYLVFNPGGKTVLIFSFLVSLTEQNDAQTCSHFQTGKCWSQCSQP